MNWCQSVKFRDALPKKIMLYIEKIPYPHIISRLSQLTSRINSETATSMCLSLFKKIRGLGATSQQYDTVNEKEINHVKCKCRCCPTYNKSNPTREYPEIFRDYIPRKHWNANQCQEWIIDASIFHCNVSLNRACEVATTILQSDPQPSAKDKVHILYSMHAHSWIELLGANGQEIYEYLRGVEHRSL